MRAFVINEYAHPSKIPATASFPEPKAGKGQVLVDVYSAGLNYFDILQAQGKYQVQPPRPFVLGNEFAGKISADSPIPDGCPFRPGDRVFGGGQGAYAEKVAVPWQNLVPLPDNMSYDQGAGLYVTWPTSYEALVGRAELKAGEWVLVTASAGGVGIAAVQLAKALGAKVIAAAGSQEKLDISIRHGGADHGVNYSKDGWQKEVLKLTGGKGVDVVYDPVGLIRDSLKCIAWKGRAIVVGFAAGSIEKLPLNLVLLKNISIVGIHWGAYSRFEPARVPVVWRSLLDLFSSGRAKPIVYPETFPLERLADGLAALEKRKTWGKVIVHVRDSESSQERAKL
ncbi:alcohol dehydrogenase [Trametes sanguinea]|nr:alcohol dehydrogenase [Trametes sanguinea]